jgi:hypothetical protein
VRSSRAEPHPEQENYTLDITDHLKKKGIHWPKIREGDSKLGEIASACMACLAMTLFWGSDAGPGPRPKGGR